jgi:hypothetical protein
MFVSDRGCPGPETDEASCLRLPVTPFDVIKTRLQAQDPTLGRLHLKNATAITRPGGGDHTQPLVS